MSRNHLRSQKISEVVPPIRIDSIVGLTLVDFYLVFVKGCWECDWRSRIDGDQAEFCIVL